MDKYNVICEIGKGSYGRVSKIVRKSDKKLLIWKELNCGNIPAKEKQFITNEISILKELDHPNIVKQYEVIKDDLNSKIFIVMEYCEEGDLNKLILKNKNNKNLIDEKIIWDIIIQSLDALNYLHNEKKILHRDIKPSNIFLNKNYKIKLGDFGFSRQYFIGYAKTILGTPLYMPPEILERKPYNEKADIWALGCSIYELATFHTPYYASNIKILYNNIKNGLPKRIDKKYSNELWNFILKLLTFDHNNRPNTLQLINIYDEFMLSKNNKLLKDDENIKVKWENIILYEKKLMEKEKELNEKDKIQKEKEKLFLKEDKRQKEKEKELMEREKRLIEMLNQFEEEKKKQKEKEKILLQKEKDIKEQEEILKGNKKNFLKRNNSLNNIINIDNYLNNNINNINQMKKNNNSYDLKYINTNINENNLNKNIINDKYNELFNNKINLIDNQINNNQLNINNNQNELNNINIKKDLNNLNNNKKYNKIKSCSLDSKITKNILNNNFIDNNNNNNYIKNIYNNNHIIINQNFNYDNNNNNSINEINNTQNNLNKNINSNENNIYCLNNNETNINKMNLNNNLNNMNNFINKKNHENNINNNSSCKQYSSILILKANKKFPKVGLKNLGDTSYLNAVLQIIGSFKEFAKYFLNPNNINYINSMKDKMPLSFSLQQLFLNIYPKEIENKKNYNPSSILKAISSLNLENKYTQDSRNNPILLIKDILSILEKELNSKNIKEENNLYYNKNDREDTIKKKFNYLINTHNSIIFNSLNYFKINEYECSTCKTKIYDFMTFTSLNLEIYGYYKKLSSNFYLNNKKKLTIYDCLKYQSLKIKEMKCEKCDDNKQMKVSSNIFSSPNIFLFLLGRGINFNKNNEKLKIPFLIEEKLNLNNFIENKSVPLNYELNGIVSISINDKKYIAFYNSFIDNQWYYFNDEEVNKIEFNKVIKINNDNKYYIPCILIYKSIINK